MSNATLFIPDITGFTKFVKSTEISHSKHIIEELINIILKNGSDLFEVAEVEGDAVFFYKDEEVPVDEVVKTARNIFVAFHSHIKQYEHGRICNCGACKQTIDLKLKFIVHSGEMSFAKFDTQKAKPYGDSVITVHRLLKNNIDLSQYILFSDQYLKEISLEFDGEDSLNDPSLGAIPFKYLKIDHWKNEVVLHENRWIVDEVDMEVDDAVSITMPTDWLYQYISDFQYRQLWNKEASKVVYDGKEVNRSGTEHHCIVKGQDLYFNTIKPKSRPDVLAYGEVLKDPAPLKYFESNFLLTPVSVKETQLKMILRASMKWKIQLLFMPLIKRKLKQQINHVLTAIKDSIPINKDKLPEDLLTQS